MACDAGLKMLELHTVPRAGKMAAQQKDVKSAFKVEKKSAFKVEKKRIVL